MVIFITIDHTASFQLKCYSVIRNSIKRAGCEVTMLDPVSLPIVSAVGMICLGLCIALARACFVRTGNRAHYRSAGVWAVCFALALIGCLLLADLFGLGASFVFACAVLVCAPIASYLLERWWCKRDIAAAVAYLQMHRIPSAIAPEREESRVNNQEKDEWQKSQVSTVDQHTYRDSVDEELAGEWCGTDYFCARAARTYDLTRREEEILHLLIEGKSFASIAGDLYVSDNTIKTHVQHIYRKMGVNRKHELSEKVFG